MFGKEKKAGLLMMGNDYSYLAITKDDKGYKVSQFICKDAYKGDIEEMVSEERVKTNVVFFRVKVTGPDAHYRFSYSEDGINFRDIGREFTARPDKWIGAKVGIFCVSKEGAAVGGYADIDWFRIDK